MDEKARETSREMSLWDRVRRPVRRLTRSVHPSDAARLVMTRPRADVYEKDGELVYEAELPGIAKDDVAVRIEDGRLTVVGESKRSETVERDDYYRMERSYGRLERSFALPADRVEPSEANAQFEDGVLRVSIPLKEWVIESKKPVELEIN